MITSKHSLPLVVALTCAAATVASCARIEAEVPAAKVTQKGVRFLGIPGGAQLGEVSTTQSFSLTSDNLSWAKEMNSEVYANAVELKTLGDLRDFDFIHFARVVMSSTESKVEIPPVEIINYQRAEGAPPTADLTVRTLTPIDVTKVWAAGKVTITMQLAGVFPEQDWAADVILHLAGKMSYKL